MNQMVTPLIEVSAMGGFPQAINALRSAAGSDTLTQSTQGVPILRYPQDSEMDYLTSPFVILLSVLGTRADMIPVQEAFPNGGRGGDILS